ncbi:TetR/AcrR family transcriptional regulator [Mycolicibacterium smegmatis]|uniref:TetR/AcrR family transcriptional regulator n=1 Tax=Mycolicibacterium smegmatis TaxID=1772 RepID=UPI0005D7508F|nr:TetR/AcrR family transcriptional regulator [Mycolicibacterium smegmatis]MDF1898285.1 TetR/AcrR family transcriptional regulator [Mycolicibacterium smegmatis]MDF1906316.1 TetR/AcrR family transcriptional regulator [Mycolicibacterium smegmatis]MDF1916532.1 TetR/AcrR family transcriptional regulator [Mycolicibacterium smegmatis]MDF1922626.1 TetR/AcrR family transcriptional regulator [Mycolicibacterium smegmatis]UAK56911.1 TetR/AcrR family transcriptional regulator [Mycolicibacterium smegmatis]
MAAGDVRQRAIEAAVELFHREGFGAVGIDRLTSSIGMSKRTLYKYFDSKDDLLLAVLDSCEEMAIGNLPDESDGATPRERMLDVFDRQAKYCAEPDFSGCFFVNIATEFRDPTHQAVQMAANHKARLTQFFLRQAALAGVSEAAASELAEQLTVLHTGAADYALMYGHYPESTKNTAAALLTAAGI